MQPLSLEPGQIRTTCPYCGVGCGILAKADGKGGLSVQGDPDHPANKGRLCSKGSALGETVGLEGRLLAPRVFGQEVAWDDALGVVAKRFSKVIADHGPDAVAFYVSGQLLTEDYYVANKLMKGFIGSANIDTNSRLCMASSVAGHKRAFGSDTVPGLYEDLELADLVVLTGSNLAWCHPVLYQRIAAAKTARPQMKIVVIDPRRTATCDIADLHLAIAPGSDAALFNALLVAIADKGAVDLDYLANVAGYAEALTAACASDPAETGLSAADLAAFVDLWASTEKVVTVYSQGINQSSSGSDKVNAIINCHLATGRIGRPGMGPFSVTGQPNAMGGREVGGLANMLTCHLDIENQTHRDAVQGFWHSPKMAEKPGLKAVDMFRAVADGSIKAIWIIHTNPAVTMPDADAVAAAVKACPFVVVSDITAETDTARLAHVLLPATAWGEKSGTVTNSDRTISRQRGVLSRPGRARPDWWALAQVASRMGYSGFAWRNEVDIFTEYAALSGVAGGLGSDFDISNLAGISALQYDALTPFTWPQNPRQQGGRFFGTGQFHTADGRARMLPITPRAPQALTPAHPFRLNTGRIRDQWHTMTRTAKSPRLSQHLAEPFVEIHPGDATRLNIQPNDLVALSNSHGRNILRALISVNVAPGQLFAPMHWTSENASAARIDALVPGIVDPISGQPESKAAAVAAQLYAAQWFGFAVSTAPLHPSAEYWARAKVQGGWRMELAGLIAPEDWVSYTRQLFALPEAETATVIDAKRGLARIAFHAEGRLLAALFVGPAPVTVARDHLAGRLNEASPAVLAGRPSADMPDPGATVCACLNIGINTIREAIQSGRALSVAALGEALGAGTSCGSCRPELAGLLSRFKLPEAAE
ncbi:MAG: molybdopterin-dependent oxidoreductase [Pseudomonadota bacterium]